MVVEAQSSEKYASVSFGEYTFSCLNSSVEKVGQDPACRDNHPGDDGISTSCFRFSEVWLQILELFTLFTAEQSLPLTDPQSTSAED